jgi:hypothetical protein
MRRAAATRGTIRADCSRRHASVVATAQQQGLWCDLANPFIKDQMTIRHSDD